MSEQSASVHASGLTRRAFLIATASAAGGLAIGVALPRATRAAGALAAGPWKALPEAHGAEVNAWVLIEPDDRVVIRVAQSEMGEGIFTALPMIVAEELECDWTKVRAEYASANRNFRQRKPYHRMATGGSHAVRRSHRFLQQAGASARERLIVAAAARLGVVAAECRAENGRVVHGASGRSIGYGAVAGDAAKVRLAREPAIKTPDRYRLIGRPTARLDTPVKVDGTAIFGLDVRVPDMLYAAVATCPVFGGKLKRYDEAAIRGRRGVHAVVPIERGVAVVADRFWHARAALEALPIEWDGGANAGLDSAALRRRYRELVDQPGVVARNDGDAPGALAAAGSGVIEALYEAPFLAHATMEPLNCTAWVRPDRVDVWMGTQSPESSTTLAASVSGVPVENVYVHNCFLGGGFGRRSINDELVEAVTVSKAVGRPVKLVWTRERDMQHDRYRPMAAIRFRAALGPDGLPAAWQARTAVGSILESLGWGKVESGIEPMAIEGLANMPYRCPNARVECALERSPVPVSFWRSVGSSQNAFALESFVDELAHAAGRDPYDFRRTLLAGRADFLGVLDTLAEKSGWGKPLPSGRGRGMAIHESFGTIVGEVAEVSVDENGAVEVERVVAVVDCGHVVNPRTVEMQMESGIVYGLTAARFGEISIREGRVVQANFDTYPMMRIADMPRVEVHLALSGGTKWGGIGEPGTPPIAPAVCNAVFAATGVRIRSLPIRDRVRKARASARAAGRSAA